VSDRAAGLLKICFSGAAMSIDPNNPDARRLVQQLSRAAATLDRALSGPPEQPAYNVDYSKRQEQIEQRTRHELKAVRDALLTMSLE
jgi:hypothetical protein